VRRQLGNVQGVRRLSPEFAQGNAAARVNRHAALQIRESKIHSSIPAIGRAQDGKQSLVLVYRQQLPIAEGPSLWREIPTDDLYLTQKWFRHAAILRDRNSSNL
jgi:hypothetical protein